VNVISRGFRGRRSMDAPPGRVPPGQYVTPGFPVLSAGPTPVIPQADWRLTIRERGQDVRAWTWQEFIALASEEISVDLHCVTKWTKLDTRWLGVPVEVLLDGLDREARFVKVYSYGGYTTNLPLEDLIGGKAWVVHGYDGRDLDPEHGGPARLLVPHLYLWKSAKWVSAMELLEQDEPGFWERYGYHAYGDPWREQRYAGD
jgi:DMSO/TMAO reductase YedYZ molybdopterin-dependent catalytic subunit